MVSEQSLPEQEKLKLSAETVLNNINNRLIELREKKYWAAVGKILGMTVVGFSGLALLVAFQTEIPISPNLVTVIAGISGVYGAKRSQDEKNLAVDIIESNQEKSLIEELVKQLPSNQDTSNQ